MDDFEQLFQKFDGVDHLLKFEERVKLNDEHEAHQLKLAKHASKRRAPPPPPDPVTYDFQSEADQSNLINWNGFTFDAGFVVSHVGGGMPGHVNLVAYSGKYVGANYWNISESVAFERATDFTIVSIDYAPANYDNYSIRFTGKDAAGNIIATQDEICSATTPRTITFTGFDNIRRFEIAEFDPATKTLTAGNNGTLDFPGITNITIIP